MRILPEEGGERASLFIRIRRAGSSPMEWEGSRERELSVLCPSLPSYVRRSYRALRIRRFLLKSSRGFARHRGIECDPIMLAGARAPGRRAHTERESQTDAGRPHVSCYGNLEP